MKGCSGQSVGNGHMYTSEKDYVDKHTEDYSQASVLYTLYRSLSKWLPAPTALHYACKATSHVKSQC